MCVFVRQMQFHAHTHTWPCVERLIVYVRERESEGCHRIREPCVEGERGRGGARSLDRSDAGGQRVGAKISSRESREKGKKLTREEDGRRKTRE